MKEHHFDSFFQKKHPLSINTDDTCLFETNNSKEIQLIAESFNLNKDDIESILKSSAESIFD